LKIIYRPHIKLPELNIINTTMKIWTPRMKEESDGTSKYKNNMGKEERITRQNVTDH